MNKSFKDRLEALEALETEQELDDPTAGLSDDEVLREVFNGLRAGQLGAYSWWLSGVDTYWRAIAERANDIYLERRGYVLPLTSQEIEVTIAALRDGRLQVRDWIGRPGGSNSYQL